MATYGRGDELADSGVEILESLLRVLELGKQSRQERFWPVHIIRR
jgi:hypothetical protein